MCYWCITDTLQKMATALQGVWLWFGEQITVIGAQLILNLCSK